MAVKVVHVSDISGKEADEQELGRLVVLEHPDYADLPVTLEVLPDEVAGLSSSNRFVTVEYFQPGTRKGQRMTIGLDDFNLLANPGAMDSAIQDALIEKHRSRPRAAAAAEAPSRRGKINYATLEHAGEPHRGRITEAEKEIVRNNLDKVNRRLREGGKREIDRDDPEMKQRYGL